MCSLVVHVVKSSHDSFKDQTLKKCLKNTQSSTSFLLCSNYTFTSLRTPMLQAKESIHDNMADNCIFGILSLEDDVLRLVSQHLSKTSRAIFAAAMTASSLRWAANGYSLELLEKSKIILAASSNAPKGIGRGARLEFKKYYEQPGWSILDGRDWHYTGESNIVEKLEDCDFAAVLYCRVQCLLGKAVPG